MFVEEVLEACPGHSSPLSVHEQIGCGHGYRAEPGREVRRDNEYERRGGPSGRFRLPIKIVCMRLRMFPLDLGASFKLFSQSSIAIGMNHRSAYPPLAGEFRRRRA